METLLISTGDVHSLLVMVLRQSGLKPQNLGKFPEVSDDAAGVPIPGSEPAPEEVRRPQDHVLEVLQGQPPIMVAVCFIQYLLTDQGHLLSAQLPTGQPGHRLLQVPRTDVVVIVEVCEADSRAGDTRWQEDMSVPRLWNCTGMPGTQVPVIDHLLITLELHTLGTESHPSHCDNCFFYLYST